MSCEIKDCALEGSSKSKPKRAEVAFYKRAVCVKLILLDIDDTYEFNCPTTRELALVLWQPARVNPPFRACNGPRFVLPYLRVRHTYLFFRQFRDAPAAQAEAPAKLACR